jgi:hypothetical protein
MVGNGTLWQDVEGHSRSHDMVSTDYPSKVVPVSSTHHQVMRPGADGEVLYYATQTGMWHKSFDTSVQDDRIKDAEVVWYDHANALCYQPHPEYQDKYNTQNQKTFLITLMELFFTEEVHIMLVEESIERSNREVGECAD